MKHIYSPRPLRESRQDRQTSEIQHDIDFMRKMYAERRSYNNVRHQALVGWSLVTLIVAVPIVAAIIFIANN